MAEYYIAPKSSFDATADAIREKTGSQATIEWTEDGFADAIEGIPTGGGGGWQRPSDWPDYSALSLSSNALFLTADTNIDVPFFTIKVKGTGTITLEAGTLSGGTFTPSSSQTLTNNTNATITPTPNSGYVVYRLTSTETITSFEFPTGTSSVSGFTLNNASGCVVEIYGRLSDATYFNSREQRKLLSITLLSMTSLVNIERFAYSCYSLENVKITGLSGLTNAYYAFAQCVKLAYLDLDGYDLKTLTYATQIFNNCGPLLEMNLVMDFSGLTNAFNASNFENYKGNKPPTKIAMFAANAQNFFRSTGVEKIVKPQWSTSNVTNFSYFFYVSYCLREVDLSTIDMSSATSTGNMFQNCSALEKVVMPTTLTRVDASMFASCGTLREVHFGSTSVPTMANTNAFSGVPSTCKIYVPYSEDHSILEAYQTATNWSTYASYIQEEPQT